jgi:hypothetical protein
MVIAGLEPARAAYGRVARADQSVGAFSGKVDSGFPSENATTQKNARAVSISG